jgi:glycerol-3-phosphate O-acyltransferase
VDSRDSHRNILQLALYRNQIPHIFFPESILLIATESSDVEELLCESATFLKLLLSAEFDTARSYDWKDVLVQMERRELVRRDAGRVVPLSDNEHAVSFLCSLLWPFVDAHWIAVLSLFSLQPRRTIGEELLVSQMQWFSEKLYFDGVITLFDACSKESMRCAVQVLLKHFGVLQISADEKLSLTPAFQTEEALSNFADKIARFRKSGKNAAMSKQYVLSYFGVHRARL